MNEITERRTLNYTPNRILELYDTRGIKVDVDDYVNIFYNILNCPGIIITDKIINYGYKKALYPPNVWRVQEQLFQFVNSIDITLDSELSKPQMREIYKHFYQLVISSNPETKFAKELVKAYEIPGLNLNDSFTKARNAVLSSLEPNKYKRHMYIVLALEEWVFNNDFSTIYPVFNEKLFTTLRHSPLAQVIGPLLNALTSDKPVSYSSVNHLVVKQFTKYTNKRIVNESGAHITFKTLEKLQESAPYLPTIKTLTDILARRLYQLETAPSLKLFK